MPDYIDDSDAWESSIISLSDMKYYVCLIDDFSRIIVLIYFKPHLEMRDKRKSFFL